MNRDEVGTNPADGAGPFTDAWTQHRNYLLNIGYRLVGSFSDPRVDRTRIGLFDHSLGGYEALRAMVVSRGVKGGGAHVGRGGLAQRHLLQLVDGDAHPTAPPPPVQKQVAQSLIATKGTPNTDPTNWNQASPINYVGDSTAAVQIDMDVADSQVPKLFSDHLYAALQAAGTSVAVQYRTYPGDDHQFIRNRAAVLFNIMAFYRACL
jgi:uncharacterized protein